MTPSEESVDENLNWYRMASYISEVQGAPSIAEVRGLLTRMGVKEVEPGVFRVAEGQRTELVDRNDGSCTCHSSLEKCRHLHHLSYRDKTDTLFSHQPPEADPVYSSDE